MKEKKVLEEKVCSGGGRACKDCKNVTAETQNLCGDPCGDNGCPAQEICDRKLCPELGIPCCADCSNCKEEEPLFVIVDFNRD